MRELTKLGDTAYAGKMLKLFTENCIREHAHRAQYLCNAPTGSRESPTMLEYILSNAYNAGDISYFSQYSILIRHTVFGMSDLYVPFTEATEASLVSFYAQGIQMSLAFQCNLWPARLYYSLPNKYQYV